MRFQTVVVSAFALGLLAPRPSRAQEGTLDARFAKADSGLEGLERCAFKRADLFRRSAALPPGDKPKTPSPGPAAACSAGASIESILRDPDLTRDESDNPVPAAGGAYALCLAVAKNDASECDAVSDFPDYAAGSPFPSPLALCRTYFQHFALSKALITRDPAAMDICLKSGTGGSDYMDIGSPTLRAQCELQLMAEKDLAGVCDRAHASGIETDSERAACERTAGAPWGVDPRCDDPAVFFSPGEETKAALPAQRALCLLANAAGAYRKARDGGDIGACGADGLCRAMMGGGVKSCQAYAARVAGAAKEYCPRAGSRPRRDLAEGAEGRAAALRGEIRRTENECAKFETATRESMAALRASLAGFEPKSDSGLRQRRERYDTMKKKWVHLQRKLHPDAPGVKER